MPFGAEHSSTEARSLLGGPLMCLMPGGVDEEDPTRGSPELISRRHATHRRTHTQCTPPSKVRTTGPDGMDAEERFRASHFPQAHR